MKYLIIAPAIMFAWVTLSDKNVLTAIGISIPLVILGIGILYLFVVGIITIYEQVFLVLFNRKSFGNKSRNNQE